METDCVITGDNAEVLATFPPDCIDLTVTSPPYDDMDLDFNPIPKNGLRKYNGYSWNFKALAEQLYRVTKPGGVVVWVVNDPTVDGSESLASSLQKIYFRRLGFNIHDTMIYEVAGTGAKGSNYAYWQTFEYMLILSKGTPKNTNRIADRKNIFVGSKKWASPKQDKLGTRTNRETITQECGVRTNIWRYASGFFSSGDKTDHPAPFPEQLANDHILSWSNPGDIVLDPFAGSGTTLKKAKELGRHYIGIEISADYVSNIIEKRLAATNPPLFV